MTIVEEVSIKEGVTVSDVLLVDGWGVSLLVSNEKYIF